MTPAVPLAATGRLASDLPVDTARDLDGRVVCVALDGRRRRAHVVLPPAPRPGDLAAAAALLQHAGAGDGVVVVAYGLDQADPVVLDAVTRLCAAGLDVADVVAVCDGRWVSAAWPTLPLAAGRSLPAAASEGRAADIAAASPVIPVDAPLAAAAVASVPGCGDRAAPALAPAPAPPLVAGLDEAVRGERRRRAAHRRASGVAAWATLLAPAPCPLDAWLLPGRPGGSAGGVAPGVAPVVAPGAAGGLAESSGPGDAADSAGTSGFPLRLVARALLALEEPEVRDVVVARLAPGVVPEAALDGEVAGALPPDRALAADPGGAGPLGPGAAVRRLSTLAVLAPAAQPSVRAAAWACVGAVAWGRGDRSAARAAASRALAIDPATRLARLVLGAAVLLPTATAPEERTEPPAQACAALGRPA